MKSYGCDMGLVGMACLCSCCPGEFCLQHGGHEPYLASSDLNEAQSLGTCCVHSPCRWEGSVPGPGVRVRAGDHHWDQTEGTVSADRPEGQQELKVILA